MQVFKAFMKTAYKSFSSIVLYFVIFTTIAFFISYAYTDTTSTAFSSVELNVGIIDKDNSNASKAMTKYLDSIHELVSLENETDVLLDRLFYRDVDYILVIPKDFEEKLSASEEDKLFETVQIPGIYNSAFVDQQINAYLKSVKLYLAGGFSLEDALSRTADTLDASANKVSMVTFENTSTSSVSMARIFTFYQFIPYVITSMILCGLTPILSTFWKEDLAKRISCSSTGLLSKNVQLALGSVVYALFNWLLFVITSGIFYGSDLFSEKGLLCILNSFFLLPLSVSLSLIVGSFSPSFNVTNMINNIISLGMSFVCGIFIPQAQLGENVLAVSKFLPFYWYVKNNNLISGADTEAFTYKIYWQNIGIQLLFIVAFFALALVAAKLKSTKRNS